jgi:hypothetical protein
MTDISRLVGKGGQALRVPDLFVRTSPQVLAVASHPPSPTDVELPENSHPTLGSLISNEMKERKLTSDGE